MSRLTSSLILLVILGFRLYSCTLPPTLTTDLLRNLFCAKALWKLGLDVYSVPVGDYTEELLAADFPYYYPWVPLVVFAPLSLMNLGLFWAKALLTIFELITALLISSLSGRRFLGILYFLNPASILWVSQEGQFEPLMILFMVLSMWTLVRKRPIAASLFLSLAVQTKVFAIFMIPWFIGSWLKHRKSLLYFTLAFFPTVALALTTPYLTSRLDPAFTLSFIRIHRVDSFWQLPFKSPELNYLSLAESGALLALALLMLLKVRLYWRELSPALGFIGFLLSGLGYYGWWYVLILPALLLWNVQIPYLRRLYYLSFLVPVSALWILLTNANVIPIDPPPIGANQAFRLWLHEPSPYFYHFGSQLTEQARASGFITHYEWTSMLEPYRRYSFLRIRLGIAHLELENFDQGIQFLWEGARLNPSSDELWQRLATAALKTGVRERLEAITTEWLHHHPTSERAQQFYRLARME